VRIELPNDTLEIPWASRDALLRELRPLASAADIIHLFESAGTSRPVRLSNEQQRRLHSLINQWARAGGINKPPEGISPLRNALAYGSSQLTAPADAWSRATRSLSVTPPPQF
jgi:hypothetical protein